MSLSASRVLQVTQISILFLGAHCHNENYQPPRRVANEASDSLKAERNAPMQSKDGLACISLSDVISHYGIQLASTEYGPLWTCHMKVYTVETDERSLIRG